MSLQPNTQLQSGKYRIVRFISSGGFGCTYEAEHTMLHKRVAIKEFAPKNYCDEDLLHKLRKKFLEEAVAISQMHHPNIVHVNDTFQENGTAYYVMDFIDGRSLSDMVNARGHLSEAEAKKYILQVADALKYVHSLNRLHLDVKPANIMIDSRGDAILIDFGASKHYDDQSGENTTTLLGLKTNGYAPIEQINTSFKTFSPATDIYALGATFYKLLTGNTPPNALDRLSDIEALRPLPTTIARPIRNAVNQSLNLKPKDRPQSINDFLKIFNSSTIFSGFNINIPNPLNNNKKQPEPEETTLDSGGKKNSPVGSFFEQYSPAKHIAKVVARALGIMFSVMSLTMIGDSVVGKFYEALFSKGFFCGVIAIGCLIVSRVLRQQNDQKSSSGTAKVLKGIWIAGSVLVALGCAMVALKYNVKGPAGAFFWTWAVTMSIYGIIDSRKW